MVDPQSIERFRSASAALTDRVRADLASYFGTLDLSRPEAVRDALLRFMPLLVQKYGQVAETLAMDWYEEQRSEAGVSGRFRVVPAPTSISAQRVDAKVRFLAGQLWTPDPGNILGSLSIALDKYVKQHSRDTIVWNAGREGASWARVPTGPKTCSWCLILASRDAVYVSERAASKRADGSKYHGLCDCQAVPIRRGDEYPPGYLPDDYYDMYSVARDAAGSGDIKDIAAALRREFPGHVTDGVHSH